MDAEIFGAFIAARRKEKNMTQLELARRLNVTDKAVSRWERGKGFPDISILLPLSEALDLSVLELMRSEKRSEKMKKTDNTYSDDEVKSMMTSVADIAESERRNRRENKILTCIAYLVIIISTAGLFFSGHATIPAGLICGSIMALGACGLYLFSVEGKDTRSRKIYGVIMLLGIAFSLGVLALIGVSGKILLCALFVVLCIIVVVTPR